MDTTPFGVAWDALELKHLEAFFSGPVEEGITWEAKGSDVRPEHLRRAVCAFGNADFVGYFVIGASRRADSWSIEGWDPRGRELETWVASTLANGGVRPLPSVIPRAYQLPTGKWMAVLKIHPVAVPPCMTSEGEVLQRLSGITKRVTDPTELRRLTARGEAADRRAHLEAREAADELTVGAPEGLRPALVVAVAAPSLPEDVSGRVFREALYDKVRMILRRDFYADFGFGAEVNQHGVSVWTLGSDATIARVRRHGGVAFGLVEGSLSGGALLALRAGSAVPLWAGACEVLREMAADGPAWVSVRANEGPGAEIRIERASTVDGPTDDENASVVREARRARGTPAWEP